MIAQGNAIMNNYERIGGRAEKGVYIGYSLGTIQFFVGLAEFEGVDFGEGTKNIKDLYEKAILMAPCTILGPYMTEPFLTEESMAGIFNPWYMTGEKWYSVPTDNWDEDLAAFC